VQPNAGKLKSENVCLAKHKTRAAKDSLKIEVSNQYTRSRPIMRCCLHCFIDYDKAVVPVKICLKSSIYCFFLSPHHMAAGHAQPHFCYTCSSPKRIASSISILYKNRGFPFRLSTFEFIPERKPLDDRLARKHPRNAPLDLSSPLNPNGFPIVREAAELVELFPSAVTTI
jgi:hypothetical protein